MLSTLAIYSAALTCARIIIEMHDEPLQKSVSGSASCISYYVYLYMYIDSFQQRCTSFAVDMILQFPQSSAAIQSKSGEPAAK